MRSLADEIARAAEIVRNGGPGPTAETLAQWAWLVSVAAEEEHRHEVAFQYIVDALGPNAEEIVDDAYEAADARIKEEANVCPLCAGEIDSISVPTGTYRLLSALWHQTRYHQGRAADDRANGAESSA